MQRSIVLCAKRQYVSVVLSLLTLPTYLVMHNIYFRRLIVFKFNLDDPIPREQRTYSGR